MMNQKRFQVQNLKSDDYEKTEAGAKAVKEGGIIISALAMIVIAGKKFGPSFINNSAKLLKK